MAVTRARGCVRRVGRYASSVAGPLDELFPGWRAPGEAPELRPLHARVLEVPLGDESVACDLVVMAAPPSARYELASQAGAQIRWHEGAFEVVADDAGRAGDALYAIGSCTGRLGDAAAAQAERAGALAGGGRE